MIVKKIVTCADDLDEAKKWCIDRLKQRYWNEVLMDELDFGFQVKVRKKENGLIEVIAEYEIERVSEKRA